MKTENSGVARGRGTGGLALALFLTKPNIWYSYKISQSLWYLPNLGWLRPWRKLKWREANKLVPFKAVSWPSRPIKINAANSLVTWGIGDICRYVCFVTTRLWHRASPILSSVGQWKLHSFTYRVKFLSFDAIFLFRDQISTSTIAVARSTSLSRFHDSSLERDE